MVYKMFAGVGVVMALVLSGCVEKRETKPPVTDSVTTRMLRAMVEEDQQMRLNDTLSWDIVAEADRAHRETVFELLAAGALKDPKDKHLAAFILQHAEPSACLECYLIAHKLAAEAVRQGLEGARYLAASSLDRYLVFSDQPQKYGTQHNIDSAGQYYLYPLDTLTSDSERLVWDVPRLEALQANIDRMNTERQKEK